MEKYDVIVVGAGVEGSATAWQLATTGKNILLLEQFNLPHTRGSSHGQSRIMRRSYTQDFYTNMMEEAYRMWYQLERITKTKLFTQTGLLTVGVPPSNIVSESCASLEKFNIPFERYSAQQAREKFPALQLSDNYETVYEASGGVLKADKCIHALQVAFEQAGGSIRDNEKVSKIRPEKGCVVVETAKGAKFQAGSVVICAGPWAGKLLSSSLALNLPLQPQLVGVYYWKQKTEHPSLSPATIFDCGRFHCYSLPVSEYPQLFKLCLHNGAEIDPDMRESGSTYESEQADLQTISKFIRQHLPGIEADRPAIVEKCIYTMTPDNHPVLDRHPLYPNVVIAAGFSGHGFKLAPVVGKILAELSLNKQPSYNLSPFKATRFSKVLPAAKY